MSDSKTFNILDGLNGNQADHILMTAHGAKEALQNLESLFKAIMTEAGEHSNIWCLARLGNYHAMDQGNVTDCFIESLERGEVS